jgi:hypothetical protein
VFAGLLFVNLLYKFASTHFNHNLFSGVDDDLDKKRRLQNGLPDLLYQVVQREIEDLPSFMIECAMIYVPHIGYLLAIQPWWNQDQQPPDVDNFEGVGWLEHS